MGVADPALNGSDIAIDLLFFVGAFAVGRVVRRRQKHVELVSIVAADLQEDAVRRERERIARELHDVIAHGMSVMVVQADAARHGVSPGDEATRTALEQIERTGRESLREMRRLLGLLRDDDAAGAALEPQPGLAGVDALVTSVRQAGLPVDLRVVGRGACRSRRESTSLPTGSCRRPSRTRSGTPARHGRRSRSPTATNAVSLTVEDTGRANGSAGGEGHGLVGMRERVRLYGGSLDDGRRAARVRRPGDAPARGTADEHRHSRPARGRPATRPRGVPASALAGRGARDRGRGGRWCAGRGRRATLPAGCRRDGHPDAGHGRAGLRPRQILAAHAARRESSSSRRSTSTSTSSARCRRARRASCSRTRRSTSWSPRSGVVAAGDGLLAPSVTRRVIEEFARRPGPARPADGAPLAELTAREQRGAPARSSRGLSQRGDRRGALRQRGDGQDARPLDAAEAAACETAPSS